MELLLYIVGGIVGLRVTVALIRGSWGRQAGDRWKTQSEAHRQGLFQRRREEARKAADAMVERFFPHLRSAVEARLERGAQPKAALREALKESPGVDVGTSSLRLPVILPAALRTRHVALIGKSGYGKTSVMNLLIDDSLRSDAPVIVICPEREIFDDYLLALVPEERLDKLLMFSPARSPNITFNAFLMEPGDTRARVAAELFSITKRGAGEDGSLGPRSDPILANAIFAIVGRPDASLEAVRRFIADAEYRAAVLRDEPDPYIRNYWECVYPQYPNGAATPLLNRLDGFLRNPMIRKVLTNPVSSVSMRRVIAERQVLFVDLFGLTPEEIRHVGELLLAKLQLELVRLGEAPGSTRPEVHVYIDELPAVAGTSEQSLQVFWSRGRKYGAAFCVGLQHPSQLSQRLRDELFGNTSSILVFNVSAKDAGTIRRELLVPSPDGSRKPVTAERLVSLGVGQAVGRVGAGTCALTIDFKQPIPEQDRKQADLVRERTWKTHGAPPLPEARVDTPTVAAVASGKNTEVVVLPASPSPGRGSKQHKLLQDLARQWGEAQGFRVAVEQDILGGAGRVDVLLSRGDMRIAVEVSVTSTGRQVADTVSKCLAAGLTQVVVVGSDVSTLRRAEELTRRETPAKDRNSVRFLSPDGLKSWLESLPGTPDDGSRTAGYAVRIKSAWNGGDAHRRTLARLLGGALLRRKSSP
ncbi:MAG: type IV secretion system DNA-binding domain-containing protein [Gemmatimonadetes bacterium]|nr:type IV secretion system DNA-binding domain-containing protein [Gemmatimonadota bacterium]